MLKFDIDEITTLSYSIIKDGYSKQVYIGYDIEGRKEIIIHIIDGKIKYIEVEE